MGDMADWMLEQESSLDEEFDVDDYQFDQRLKSRNYRLDSRYEKEKEYVHMKVNDDRRNKIRRGQIESILLALIEKPDEIVAKVSDECPGPDMDTPLEEVIHFLLPSFLQDRKNQERLVTLLFSMAAIRAENRHDPVLPADISVEFWNILEYFDLKLVKETC